ncbi:MAG: hypothetical protein HRT45_17675 [Bdellovibrionales bacterium]|nr:hypothetical protein [Bdellovibrionales bacterium]
MILKPNVVVLTLIMLLGSSISAHASNVDWSGVYRIEGYSIVNSELNDKNRQKDFGLQHLVLRPKIVAADGLEIFGQFNIFNMSNNTAGLNANTQVGQIFGNGVNQAGTTSNNFPDSNSQAQNNRAEDLQVSQLYLTFNHEYGQIIAGRAPIHFGLGMYHNAGMGLFDHFYDTRDLVGYKIVAGNIWVMPMIGKLAEGTLNRTDDVTDFMVQLQYDNPDTMVEMGAFYQVRKSGEQGSDGPTDSAAGNDYFGAGSQANDIDSQTINLYAKRNAETWSMGFEVGLQSGDLGVRNGNGNDVTLGGSGVAIELEFMPEDSPSEFFLKAGYATGDDKETDGSFEGFFFDRNYNVGFLLMNQTLGQGDFFNTGFNGGGPNPTTGENDNVDIETVSNVIYLAPGFRYGWNERWSSSFTLVTGWLQQDAVTDQDSRELGYEVDMTLEFQPQEGILWMTELGLLSPGAAFKGAEGTANEFESKFAYGLSMKAAISF